MYTFAIKVLQTSHLRRLLVAHTILQIYDYLLTRKKMYVEGITVGNIHVVIYRKIMDAYKNSPLASQLY